MATLRSRVAGRDRELFVARTRELEFFDSVLRGDSPIRIVHVGGVAGIGKSSHGSPLALVAVGSVLAVTRRRKSTPS